MSETGTHANPNHPDPESEETTRRASADESSGNEDQSSGKEK
jgi:hypothetical protein